MQKRFRQVPYIVKRDITNQCYYVIQRGKPILTIKKKPEVGTLAPCITRLCVMRSSTASMGCNMIYPVIPSIRPPVTCSLRTKLQYTMRHQGKVLTDIAADLKNMEGVRTRNGVLARLRLRRNQVDVERAASKLDRYYKALVK